MSIQQAYEVALQHHRAGRLAEAEGLYRQILVVEPRHAEALHFLGVIAHQVGQNDAAVELIRQAIALRPGYPEAHNNLGHTLHGQGQLDEAVAAYRQAIVFQPDYAEAHYNLGIGLYDKGLLDEAGAAYRRAIALKAGFAEAHNNLGKTLKDKGQWDEATAAYRQAIAFKPNHAEAHWNLGLALLVQGIFAEGWQEYEWRWKTRGISPERNFTQPRWDGRALAGGTLLLDAEQGFGDAIQFIRYLPVVAQSGGRVIIGCQPELRRLFQRMAPDLPVVAHGQPLPAFEVHCPLLSLPGIFATDLDNIPGAVPYLHADAAEARIWRDRLAGDVTSFKVGLVWAGNSSHQNDRNRSLKLSAFMPLAEVSGVQLYVIQKGDAAAEARIPPQGMKLVDVAGELNDFADTAALLANLDLVISADTAVAHLAGAMGRPVWTLLPFAPDWRWLLGRTDSPWYPTMRLFRQPKIGDWDTVIGEVCEQLPLLVQERREAS